jgi:NAD(P)-dependent dehydrogenase (short-subunit alcohol dehydrogenase family)
MSNDYAGRNVVVTGATGGLGEAVVRILLGTGATVHIPVRHPGKARTLYAGADRVHVASVPDLGDEAAVGAFYAGLPPLWASIHCAGGFAMSRIDETPLSELRAMLDINAVPTFLCCREAVKAMRARRQDRQRHGAAGVEPGAAAGWPPTRPARRRSQRSAGARRRGRGEGIWVNAVVP